MFSVVKVKHALSTPQPSELLLQGMVSAEVRNIEATLERKVQLCMICLYLCGMRDWVNCYGRL